jgi:hypothetical protein
MGDSRLPTEVELVFEVMPCNALRTAQEPGRAPHPCSYFRRWGSYHSYDYAVTGRRRGGASSTTRSTSAADRWCPRC